MKQARSASAHHPIKQTYSTKQSPNTKLTEINNKINNMLLKVKNPKDTVDLSDNPLNSLQIQYSYTRVLASLQKEKNQLMSLIQQKDSIIQEQMKKINAQNVEIKNYQNQLQKYTQIPMQMEQLEEQCSSIIKENSKLKQQICQLQTSFNFLQSQQMQSIVVEFDIQIRNLSTSLQKCLKLLDYASHKQYNDFQILIDLKSKQEKEIIKSEHNLNTILRNGIDQIRQLIFEAEKCFENNFQKISDQIFYSYQYS